MSSVFHSADFLDRGYFKGYTKDTTFPYYMTRRGMNSIRRYDVPNISLSE